MEEISLQTVSLHDEENQLWTEINNTKSTAVIILGDQQQTESIGTENDEEENEEFNADAFLAIAERLSMLLKLRSVIESDDMATNTFSLETFYCEICMENCSTSLKFSVVNCHENHTYCRPCLNGYCSAMVSSGNVEIFCPGVATCKACFKPEELQQLLPEDEYSKYSRLYQVKRNPFYRECPVCNTGVSAANTSPDLTCVTCSTRYCFFHANAHPGMNCRQYVRNQSYRVRRELAATNAIVCKTTRCCPWCQSPTEKNGGCNHMTCQSCHNNWCWICQRKITGSTSSHYSPVNVLFGCPGGQYQSDFDVINHIASIFDPCSSTMARGVLYLLSCIGFIFRTVRYCMLALVGVAGVLVPGLPAMLILAPVCLLLRKLWKWKVYFKFIPLFGGVFMSAILAATLDIVLVIAMIPFCVLLFVSIAGNRREKMRICAKWIESVSFVMFMKHLIR